MHQPKGLGGSDVLADVFHNPPNSLLCPPITYKYDKLLFALFRQVRIPLSGFLIEVSFLLFKCCLGLYFSISKVE